MIRELKGYQISIILSLLAIIGFCLNYLLNIFLANHMTAKFYGDFMIALNILFLGGTLALLGTNYSSRRFLAKYLSYKDDVNIQNFIRWNIKFISLPFLLCFMFAIISLLVMHLLHYFNIKDISSYHLSIYMLWIIPILAIFNLLNSYLLSNRHSLIAQFMSNLVQNIVLLSMLVVAILFFNIILNTINIILILLCTFFVIVIIDVLLVYIKIPFLFNRTALRFYSSSVADEKIWRKTSLNISCYMLGLMVLNFIGLLLIEVFASHEADVGYFGAMSTIVGLVTFVSATPFNFILPKISVYLQQDTLHENLSCDLKHANAIFFPLLCTLMIGTILFSRILLSHFGENYIAVQYPLIILIIATGISACSQMAAYLLIYTGYERIGIYFIVMQFVVSLILGIILTHYYDLLGTTIAVSVAMILTAVGKVLYVKKYLKIKTLSFI